MGGRWKMRKMLMIFGVCAVGITFPGIIHYNHVQGQKIEKEESSLIQEMNKHDALLVKMGEVNGNLERMISLQAIIEGIPASERNPEGYEELNRISETIKKDLRKMDKTHHEIMDDEFVKNYPSWRKEIMNQVRIIQRYVETMQQNSKRG